jgi:hypothetical protein
MATGAMAGIASLWEVRDRGFLPARINCELLPDVLRAHEQAYLELPELSQRGQVGARLSALPLVNIVFDYERYYDSSCLLIERAEDAEAAFSLFAVLASAFVHKDSIEFQTASPAVAAAIQARQAAGAAAAAAPAAGRGPRPSLVLPACLAVPLKALAVATGRKPIWDYAGCVLSNWQLHEQSRGVTLDNIRIVRTFTRLPAEEWFFKIHVAIESQGAAALGAILAIHKLAQSSLAESEVEETVEFRTVDKVVAGLERVRDSLESMNGVLARMGEHCRDHEFFNIVRPWLSGWPDSGVVYATAESCDVAPEHLSGGSGAQSSLMPCLDLFLGVAHGVTARVTQASLAAHEQQQQQQQQQQQEEEAPKQQEQHHLDEHAATAAAAEAEVAKMVANLALQNEAAALSSAAQAEADEAAALSSAAQAEADEARRRFILSLKRYQEHMPPPHRALVAFLESSQNMRDFIQNLEKQQLDLKRRSVDTSLPIFVNEQFRMKYVNLGRLVSRVKLRYNDCIEQILAFRRKHIGFAIAYVTTQAKKRARDMKAAAEKQGLVSPEEAAEAEVRAKEMAARGAKGTGGSTFRDHLMQHVSDTRRCLYGLSPEDVAQAGHGHAANASSSSQGGAAQPAPVPLLKAYQRQQRYVLPGLGPHLPSSSLFGKKPRPIIYGITTTAAAATATTTTTTTTTQHGTTTTTTTTTTQHGTAAGPASPASSPPGSLPRRPAGPLFGAGSPLGKPRLSGLGLQERTAADRTRGTDASPRPPSPPRRHPSAPT